MSEKFQYGTGRRKTATARTRLMASMVSSAEEPESKNTADSMQFPRWNSSR